MGFPCSKNHRHCYSGRQGGRPGTHPGCPQWETQVQRGERPVVTSGSMGELWVVYAVTS